MTQSIKVGAVAFVAALLASGCTGQAVRTSSLPPDVSAGGRVTTTASVTPASGASLAAILQRRQAIASHARAPRVQKVVGVGDSGGGGGGMGGGAHGVSCKGGCVGGTSTNMGNGTLFNVQVTAPTAGTYTITGYTTDSHGVRTPIPSYTVTVSASQAGPTEQVNASVFIGNQYDMDNGISITVTGPNDDEDPFDSLCDTGTGSWDFAP